MVFCFGATYRARTYVEEPLFGQRPQRGSFALAELATRGRGSSPDGEYHSPRVVSSITPSPIFRFVPKRNIAVEHQNCYPWATRFSFLVATSSASLRSAPSPQREGFLFHLFAVSLPLSLLTTKTDLQQIEKQRNAG